LVAEPVLLRAERPAAVLEGPASLWYNPAAAPAIGLAAPVKRLLQSLHTD
jgi:A/G-specific adenine glycosylase